MADERQPQFVVGDQRKALRVLLRDADGAAVDISTGVATLLADGIDSGNRIGGAGGITGAFVTDGTDGLVDFAAIGDNADIGTGRGAEVYQYRVQYVDGGMTSYTTPIVTLIVYAGPA